MRKAFFGCILAIVMISPRAGAAPDTLRFHPPDSLVFTAVTTSAKVADINGKVMRDSTSTTAKGTLKKVAYGYSLKYEPMEVRVSRDGKEVTNPVVALMSRIGYTYVLDSSGMASSVTGFENIYQRIDSALDSSNAAQIKKMVTPDAMAAQTIAEWNGRMEMLTNRPFNLKKTTYDKTEYVLPTQQKIAMYGGTVIADTPSVGGIPCVRVRVVYSSSPDSLAKLLYLKRADIIAHYMLTDSTLKSIALQPAQITSDITLVAEQQSLLVREENSRRNASIQIPGQGAEPQHFTSQETRHVKMSY